KRKNNFDYSMHLTMGSIWMPTFLPYFNLPFIWGPIGGGEGEPRSFLKTLPLKKRILQYLRLFMNDISFFNPFIFVPCFRAKGILVPTANSLKAILSFFRDKMKVVLETAMESDVFYYHKIKKGVTNKEIQLITTGRLIPSTNILSVIKALQYIYPE